MGKRPDRSQINEKMKEKQNEDAEKKGSGGGDFINCFDFSKYKDVEFFKLEADEEHLIDIIPYEVTSKNHPDYKKLPDYDGYKEDYVLSYYCHKRIGPGGKATVICPQENYGKSCPICEERERLLNEKIHEWNDKELAPYKTKLRTMFNIIDLNDENKAKVFDYPHAWFLKNVLKRSKRVRGANSQVCLSDISDDGYSLSFYPELSEFTTAKGKEMAGEVKTVDFVERKEGYEDSIIGDAIPLDQCLNILSYDELEAIMHGTNEEEDDTETDEAVETKEETAIDETEQPKKRERRERPKPTDNKCPNGFDYGKDNLSFDDCDNCSVKNECEKVYNEKYAD